MKFKKLLTLLHCVLFISVFAKNDRYRLMLTDDPSSTIMVGWNQRSGSNPTIYYGTTDYGTNWQMYANSKSIDRSVYFNFMHNTFAKLEGLTPNTAYYFVIKDSEGVSKRFWFKTAPSTNERLSFIAGGDSRNNRDVRINANKLVAKLKPHAVFFGGDMTNLDTFLEWKQWLDDWQHTIAEDGRMFPIVVARGNHEKSNNVIYNTFNTPSTDVYYALTFGENLIRSYTLNSEIPSGGNQVNWLQNDLQQNENVVWKMAQYHKPMRPHVSSKSEGNDEYVNWANLFYEHNVNLVCESDSHTVKSTWPIKPCSSGENCEDGFERDDVNGTVYVGEGCWGAPLRNSNDAKNWTRDSGSFNQFKLIFVDNSSMEIRTVVVEDAANVAEVSNTNVFAIPNNLKLWNASNGTVITLKNEKGLTPIVTFKNLENEQAVSDSLETDIALEIESQLPIELVSFSVNDNPIGTIERAPYKLSHVFSKGRNKIEATVYTKDFQYYSTAVIYVNAGEFSKTVSTQIATSKDDVEEGIDASGELYYDSSDLEMGFDYGWTAFGTNQYVGLRFQNVAIPKGATITNAYIEFTAEDAQSNYVNLNIAAHNVANATEFSNYYAVSSRERVANTVNWSPNKWYSGEVSNNTRTPNLATQLQTIVNKTNWEFGNAMSFTIWDANATRNRRKAYTYDKDKSKAAKLIISYEFNKNETVTTRIALNNSNTVVYPNPFNEKIQVNLSKKYANIIVEIYNFAGFLIAKNTLKNKDGSLVISTKNIKSGSYILKVKDSESKQILTKQLIKN